MAGVDVTALVDEKWMRRALELAARGDYRTSPNPMVGAVVVDSSGQNLGEGFHHGPGQAHAETIALEQAGDRARDATLYVSLEPCCHQGRTHPCTERIIGSGVRRVVAAMADPDSRVDGQGFAVLRGAGISVDVGVLDVDAAHLNEFYVVHRRTGRPFVAAKWAMSLDGRIATASGESRWISGPESRAHAHMLRHRHDAVMIGAGTLAADDPELTTRLPDRPDARQPLRVVLDSRLSISSAARVLNPAVTPGGSRTLIAAAPGLAQTERAGALVDLGAEVVEVPATPDGRLRLAALLNSLGERGITSVLVEGGGHVHGSLFAAGLVDRVWCYLAPVVIGGDDPAGPVRGGVERLLDASRLSDIEELHLGSDILVTGRCSRA